MTRLAASGSPQVQVSPSGPVSSTRNGSVGTGRLWSVNAKFDSAHADVCDVAQARGRLPRQAETVHNVLTVRPGLHDPRGGHRGRCHGRAEPWEFLAARDGGEGVNHCFTAGAPLVEEVSGRQLGAFGGYVVDEGGRCAERGLQAGGERVRVGRGEDGDVVGPGEVRDLVRDGPAGRRARAPPLRAGRSATSWSRSLPSAARSANRACGSVMVSPFAVLGPACVTTAARSGGGVDRRR